MYANISKQLRFAAEAQPCPPCKEDIRRLADVVDHMPNLRKEDTKTLNDLSYINQFGAIGKGLARITSPFFIGEIPENIAKTIRDDKKANEATLAHLVLADTLALGMTSQILEILASYIDLTKFKIDCTPKQFWAFSRMLELGFKTHILQAAAKITTIVKL